jgi:hypothetical protein
VTLGVAGALSLLLLTGCGNDKQNCERLAKYTTKGTPVYVGEWVCIGEYDPSATPTPR